MTKGPCEEEGMGLKENRRHEEGERKRGRDQEKEGQEKKECKRSGGLKPEPFVLVPHSLPPLTKHTVQ